MCVYGYAFEFSCLQMPEKMDSYRSQFKAAGSILTCIFGVNSGPGENHVFSCCCCCQFPSDILVTYLGQVLV